MKTKRFFPRAKSLPAFLFLRTLFLLHGFVGAAAAAQEALPQKPPGIVGTITTVDEGGARVLVEAKPGEKSGSDKAMVRITKATRVCDAEGEPLANGSLKAGQRVRVWFKGPVAESYPVQGTGAVVQVLP